MLECLAVLFGLQCFFRNLSDKGILVRSDSSTVCTYINKQGGTTAQLCDVALELWEFCVLRGLTLQAVHLAGVKNVRADRLSRVDHSGHDYELTEEAFSLLCDRVTFPLEVDCFASRLTHKLDVYYSRYHDPSSSGIDAFSLRWGDGVYLFPPVPLIDRVISKVFADKPGHGVLICPLWPSQPWYPSLLDLLIAPPLLIPPGHVLDSPRRLPHSCQLVAWPIGLSLAKRQDYLGRLESVGSRGWLGKPLSLTRSAGENLVVGTINGFQVTVAPLMH